VRRSLLILLVVLPRPAVAATYHVGKSGCSNSGPGTSVQPYCAIQTGVNKLTAGDILLIGAGTYSEKVTIKSSGAAGSPIVIQAAPGAKPVIDGGGQDPQEEGLINLTGRAHVTVRGIGIQNSSHYGMHISGSSNITVEGCSVNGTEHGGIIFDQGCSNVHVIGNEVQATDKCGQGCGIHEAITMSDVAGFTVVGNKVHHGIKEGIDAKDGSTNGLIYDNELWAMGQIAIYLNHAKNVKVYRNKVHDSKGTAIQFTVGDYATGPHNTDNNDLYQNLVYGNAHNGFEFYIAGSGTLSGNRIYNNVIYGSGHRGLQLSDSGQVTGTVIRNNIFMKNTQGSIGGDTSNATIGHNLFHQTGSTVGSSAVTGDPLFVSLASFDFHLHAGSPAVDAGFDMGLPKVGQPDIGAFEHGLVGPLPDQGVIPGDLGPSKKDAGSSKKDTGLPWDGQPDLPLAPDLFFTEVGAPVYPASGGILTGGCGCGLTASPRESAGALFLLLLAFRVVKGRRR
jgi:hypothetical protein